MVSFFRRRQGAAALLLFGLFWNVITLTFDGFILYQVVKGTQAKNYPSVVGKVVRSQVRSHHDLEGGDFVSR